MLATKISFMNEIANLAERLGADIEEVRNGIGSDPRIGYNFINPGCGYGGSCFPKDVKALVRTGQQVGYEPQLLQAVDEINSTQKTTLFSKLKAYFGGEDQLADKTIAVWGLAFKPNTDDMREAPSRTLMEALWASGAMVKAYDPVALKEAERIYGKHAGLNLYSDQYEVLKGADVLVICTEWQQFLVPDFSEMAARMRSKVIVDGRNLYQPQDLNAQGWIYFSVGRPAPKNLNIHKKVESS
jgi:UDPglucose 6-dehydrogenase